MNVIALKYIPVTEHTTISGGDRILFQQTRACERTLRKEVYWLTFLPTEDKSKVTKSHVKAFL